MKEPKNLTGKIGYVEYDGESLKVFTKEGIVKVTSGNYKLVYGVPRKMWPVPTPNRGIGFKENYEYELRKKMDPKIFQSMVDDYKKANLQLLEAYEIEGYFDPDGTYWHKGAKIKMRDFKGQMTTIEVPDWRFSIYEGDKLYTLDGELVFSTTFAE